MKFGERIEAALQEMQWGPKELEQKTGVADSTISALTRRGSDRSNYKEAIIGGFPPERIDHEWLRSEAGTMKPKGHRSNRSDFVISGPDGVVEIELKNNPEFPSIRRVKLKAQAVFLRLNTFDLLILGIFTYKINIRKNIC